MTKHMKILNILAAASLALAVTNVSAEDATITHLNPEGAPDASALGYSQVSVVESGRLAFVSGQVAWTKPFEPAPESLEDQVALVVKNADAILAGLEASKKDIAMVRVYVTDLNQERLGILFPLLVDWFDGATPSLTGVGVNSLAAPDLQLEMEMTVRVPE